MKILLERDVVRPHKPNNDGRGPLWAAAWKGHLGVVKMLLERDDSNHAKPG